MKVPAFGTLHLDPAPGTGFGTLNIARQNEGHFGRGTVSSTTTISPELPPQKAGEAAPKRSFEDYLLDAVKSVNSQQLEVSDLTQKVITDPDDINVAQVTTAMAKARMSLNLAQTVIDRLISGWNEITTTR
jgi:flagellar hook-basal body complex protein FliE